MSAHSNHIVIATIILIRLLAPTAVYNVAMLVRLPDG